MVELIGSEFFAPGHPGDFAWMVEQNRYRRSLFIFNDNQDQWESHIAGMHEACFPGGGNAIIRPFQDHKPARAIGIPTGWAMRRGAGYKSLIPEVKDALDHALARVEALVKTGQYDKVIYSSDGKGSLGTGIFKVGQDVKDYIVQGLKETVNGD